MNYIASTFFDEEEWNKNGLNWVRHAKSASLNAIIIGKNLPDDAIEKINDLLYGKASEAMGTYKQVVANTFFNTEEDYEEETEEEETEE